MNLYPLTFTPSYHPKLWGGRRLASELGRGIPDGAIGESWELSDREGAESVVANGELKGMGLRQLVQEFGPRLLGERLYQRSGERFPLLVKVIDAADDLSVQVHPDDDYASLRIGPDEPGKTEMWVVLQADPGASLTAGFAPGVGREQFKDLLREERVDAALNRFPVKAGDAVMVPAGRVHAIGKGCLIAEIQQNSDTTYRVWDYKRLENGKPRALHLQQALECLRFDAPMADLPGLVDQKLIRADDCNRAVLADCPYFHVERLWVAPLFRPAAGQGGMHIVMGLRGQGRLESRGSSGLAVRPGTTVLVPASCDFSLHREGDEFQALWARVPEQG